MFGNAFDGTIIINEDEARDDIQRLQNAKEHLTEAISLLNQINAQAEDFTGNTGTVIRETIIELQGSIKRLLENADIAEENIVRTVKEYQAVDRSLRDAINGKN